MNLRFLSIGLAQGVVLSLLHIYAREFWHGYLPQWWLPSVVLAVFVPIAIYTTAQVSELKGMRRWLLIAISSVLLLGMSAYEVRIREGGVGGIEYHMATYIWCFIIIQLGAGLLANDLGAVFSKARYQLMFELSWRNGVLIALVAGVLGLFWGVLHAVAYLFNTIGIPVFKYWFNEPYLMYPLMAIAGAMLFAFGVQQRKTTTAIRNLVLTATQWLLPVVVLFSTLWLLALLLNFYEQFMNGSRGFSLLWICFLSIYFVNAAYQDGQDRKPFPTWLMATLRYLWPVIGVMSLLAVISLWVRVNEYGWTEDRVWAVFVAVIALVHAVGYSLSLLPRKNGEWMWSVHSTNLVASSVFCVLTVLMLSPVFYPKKIEVNSQFERLKQQKVDYETFDYHGYLLRSEGNRFFGRPKLEALKAGIDHPKKVEIQRLAELALQGGQVAPKENTLTKQRLAQHLKHTGKVVSTKQSEQLAAAMLEHSEHVASKCFASECYAIWADVGSAKGKEALVLYDSYQRCYSIYGIQSDNQALSHQGVMCSDAAGKSEKIIESIKSNTQDIQAKTPPWKDLVIDGDVFTFTD